MGPFYPIIYVRGYAMTQDEIESTVATPYMGFNLGSSKVRQNWKGEMERHIFESPLVRLMKDYGYRDCFEGGCERKGQLPAKSIVIHRYYEPGSRDLGTGDVPSIEEAAAGLRKLIHTVREQVCENNPQLRDTFRVYLVAHSMGGLVCRCFLQNDDISSAEDRRLVDKVFTYAAPHNGIEMAGMNVPGLLGVWDINNFNRERIAAYLKLDESREVSSLDGKFDPERFFCLVGTNSHDYSVARGLSSRLAGEMSDGLVRIENAAVKGSPRAFTYRSHSGDCGIVNSEAGYQNLVRFLFGNVKVTGVVEAESLPLPPSIRKAKDEGRDVRASYHFEATVGLRGGAAYRLTERRRETFSAILRKYDELMKPAQGSGPRWPVLFTVFLDSRKIQVGKTIVFTLELGVAATAYEVDGLLWFDREIPGESLFSETLTIRAAAREGGWSLRYNLTNSEWAEGQGRKVKEDNGVYYIPLENRKGFKGRLRLDARNWQ